MTPLCVALQRASDYAVMHRHGHRLRLRDILCGARMHGRRLASVFACDLHILSARIPTRTTTRGVPKCTETCEAVSAIYMFIF